MVAEPGGGHENGLGGCRSLLEMRRRVARTEPFARSTMWYAVVSSQTKRGNAMLRTVVFACLVLASSIAVAQDEPPPWAYPVNPPDLKPVPDNGIPRRVP